MKVELNIFYQRMTFGIDLQLLGHVDDSPVKAGINGNRIHVIMKQENGVSGCLSDIAERHVASAASCTVACREEMEQRSVCISNGVERIVFVRIHEKAS